MTQTYTPTPAPVFPNDGLYTLLHGDSLVRLEEIGTESVDAIVTDPPYSSGGLHSGTRKGSPNKKYMQGDTQNLRPEFLNDNKDQRSWSNWCHRWLTECYRVAKDGAPVVVFSDWRQLPLMTDLLQGAGFIWRGIAVWDKTPAARPFLGRYTAQCEYIVWGSKGNMPGDRGVGTLPGLYSYVVKQADKFHVTGKPTPLLSDLVKIAKPCDVVLDPFMGSGTTGEACLRMGRRFIGIEQDAYYYDLSEKRIKAVYEECHPTTTFRNLP